MCLEVLDNLVWKWTHTHTRWYWYEYMNARLKICQPHTHYNDVYYTWLPKYGQKKPGATIYLYCIWWFLERLIVVLVFRCYMNFYNDLKERKRTFYLLKKKTNIWKWFFFTERRYYCVFIWIFSFWFSRFDFELWIRWTQVEELVFISNFKRD